MLSRNLAGISFQRIEIFLVAAKYENFTKTAEELNMSQAAISRNIAEFESELGILLFVRHKKRVRLTNAGEALKKDWEAVVRQAEKALANAYHLHHEEFDRLVVGDYNTTPIDDYILPLSERFEEENPGVKLSIERSDPETVFQKLKDDLLDAAFFDYSEVGELKESGLEYSMLIDLPVCVVISDNHPLFHTENIDIASLRSEPVVSLKSPYYWAHVRAVCEAVDLQTDNVKFVDNPHTLAMELKRGKYIGIMDRYFAPFEKSELRYIELEDCKIKSGFVIAYSPENPNPHLKKLLLLCEKYYKETLGTRN